MSHWKNLRHAYLHNARPRAAQREREAGVTLIEMMVVLVMTVEPGFGGQSFMVEPLEKIAAIRDAGAADLEVQVDGGITVATLPQALQAGANVFVAGTAVFGTQDYKAAIETLRKNAEAA